MALPAWQVRAFSPGGGTINASGANAAGARIEGIQRNRLAQEQQRIAAEEQRQLQAHRAAQLGLLTRRQDFAEGAQEREIAEEQRKLQLATERGLFADKAAKGAAMSGAEAFGSLQAEAARMADPVFANLSADEMNRRVEDFKLAAGKNLTSPAAFQQKFREQLIRSGQFTEEQINTRVTARMNELYPQIDPELIKSQLIKPTMANTSTNIVNNIGGTGGGRSGKQSFSHVQGQGDLNDRAAVVKEFMAFNDITDNTKGTIGRFLDIGDRSVVASDILQLLAKTGSQVSDRAVTKALQAHMKDSGETRRSFDIRNPTPTQLKSLIADAKAIENQEQQTFEKNSGTTSTPADNAAAQGGVNSLANNLDFVRQHNASILANSGRPNFSLAQLNEKFLEGLGPRPAPAPVIDDGTAAGPLLSDDTPVDTVAAPQLTAPPAEAAAPPVPQQDALLANRATERVENLANLFETSRRGGQTTGSLNPVRKEHNKIKKLLEDLQARKTKGSGRTKGRSEEKAQALRDNARAELTKILTQGSEQEVATSRDPLAFDLLNTDI